MSTTLRQNRRAIELFPACATTGIGSLPHTQLELALQMAFQVDIPYLPQLPRQNPAELMIPAALEGLPGLSFDSDGTCTVDVDCFESERARFGAQLDAAMKGAGRSAFEPSIQACRAWRPFLFEVEQRRLSLAKIQLAGPTTVRWVAKTSDGRPLSDHSGLDPVVFRLITARALAMVSALRRLNITPLFFLDEPGLYALNPGDVRHLTALQELRLLVAALQREGALVGLHCCGNTDWKQLLGLGLNVLSLDARLSLDAVLEEKEALKKFFDSEAMLSLGMVPTDLASVYRVKELVDSVESSFRATPLPPHAFERMFSQLLLTPACGLAMRNALDAERIFEELKVAQQRMRRLAGPSALSV